MAAAVRLDVDAPFDLWVVDLSPEPQPGDIALLSEAERRRAQRFRFRRDRRRYLVAHAELRRLLMAHGPGRNSEYSTNDFGKPHLTGATGPHFNLSYAGDMALIGVSDAGAIGVDIETLRAIDDDDISSNVFDTSERAAIARTSAGPARDGAFLRAWTRKEASVKAVGTGLSTPPASVGVGIADAIRHLHIVCSGVPKSVEVGSFRTGDQVAAWARVI